MIQFEADYTTMWCLQAYFCWIPIQDFFFNRNIEFWVYLKIFTTLGMFYSIPVSLISCITKPLAMCSSQIHVVIFICLSRARLIFSTHFSRISGYSMPRWHILQTFCMVRRWRYPYITEILFFQFQNTSKFSRSHPLLHAFMPKLTCLILTSHPWNDFVILVGCLLLKKGFNILLDDHFLSFTCKV